MLAFILQQDKNNLWQHSLLVDKIDIIIIIIPHYYSGVL